MDEKIDVQACALKPLHSSCWETHAGIVVIRRSPSGHLIWTLFTTWFQFAFVYAPFSQVALPFAITAFVINPQHCCPTDREALPAPLHPVVSTLICGPQEVNVVATCHGSPIRLIKLGGITLVNVSKVNIWDVHCLVLIPLVLRLLKGQYYHFRKPFKVNYIHIYGHILFLAH